MQYFIESSGMKFEVKEEDITVSQLEVEFDLLSEKVQKKLVKSEMEYFFTNGLLAANAEVRSYTRTLGDSCQINIVKKAVIEILDILKDNTYGKRTDKDLELEISIIRIFKRPDFCESDDSISLEIQMKIAELDYNKYNGLILWFVQWENANNYVLNKIVKNLILYYNCEPTNIFKRIIKNPSFSLTLETECRLMKYSSRKDRNVKEILDYIKQNCNKK